MQSNLFDAPKNDLLALTTYEAFRAALLASNCTRCGLSEQRKNIVVDRGNVSSKIMLIGEAPGENEDKTGRPFVGRAGKLLDELMRGIGLDTNRDMLIVNIVKCRPPENRAPKTEEAATCMPFLQKQIALMKPSLIILLGATAVKPILPDHAKFAMEDMVGKFFSSSAYPGISLMVLYHTAYILRDPRKRPLMEQHLKVLKQHLATISE